MQLELPDLFLMLGNKLRMHQINCMITLIDENENFQIAYHSLSDQIRIAPSGKVNLFVNNCKSISIETQFSRYGFTTSRHTLFPGSKCILDEIKDFADED